MAGRPAPIRPVASPDVRVRAFVGGERAATYDQLRALAVVAEDHGFEGFFRSDHYLATGAAPGGPGPTDAWTTLAGLARDTSRLRLGTLVSAATFRPPGPLAIVVAEVDAMSGGRIELGLGTGYHEAEHLAYGLPFPSLGERFERLAEQLEIVTGLWATPDGGRFSFEGRHYRLSVDGDLPRPVQRPRPPVIVGGEGRRRTPALAARFADEFNIGLHDLDAARAQFDRVRRACEEVGRDPAGLRSSGVLVACCGADEAEVRHRADVVGLPVEQLRAAGAAGRPDEVVARCRQLAELGVDPLYLQFRDPDDADHLRLVGDEVIPALA